MIINQPITREAWRKLVASLKEASTTTYIPEYNESRDTSLNKRYYL
jgi:hypothetical protein